MKSPSDFLSGGGEMGALMRAHDWSATPLGPPDTWPSLLKSTIRLLLTSNHPMFIWWGPDLLQFYNDAYRATMGRERHPSALGQPGRECWAEVWDIIGPEIELVMSGRGATWHEDALVPLTRNGRQENVWWTYGYSPIEDETGVHGVLVICNDVTKDHLNKESLRRLNEELSEEVQVRKQAEAALASERDRIDAALEKSRADLAVQILDWQRLHAMSCELLQARTRQAQFEVILKTIADLHRSGKGVISLHDPKRNALVTAASIGLGADANALLACVPLGKGACGTAFETRERIIIADTETDPIYADYRQFARDEGIRALYSSPFYTRSGEPLGVLSVYFDAPRRPEARELRISDICLGQIALVVEREQAESRLHLEQQRSHKILETMKDGFIMFDAAFRVLHINSEGLRMDGRPLSELLGRTHWELWPDTYNLQVGRELRRVMSERVPARFTHCYDYFGRITWFDVSAYPHDDGIAVIYRDISEQKKVEQELARVVDESERRRRLYETFLANSPDLAYVFDLDHRFIYANEVLLKMWGKTWNEAIGKNCLELGYEPWHAEMHDREIEQVKATRKPIRGDVPFHGTFGRRIYDYIFVPVLGPDGEVEAIAGTTRDVTESRQNEAALREANQRKDEFLAMLAHELRNPLAPISAAAELMDMVQLDGKRLKDTSRIISRQVKHLTELVDDLLDVSRVTRGLTSITKTPQDVKGIVADAIEQVMPLVEAKRHHLTQDIAAGPAHVMGDRKRLVQILTNLLNNAAKYTPEGGRIHLSAQSDGATVSLAVRDDGIGIAPEMQARIFDLFTQADRTADRSQGGLGIGLALVRSLTELHGGSVTCSSEGLGKGSEFTISLPRLACGQPKGDGKDAAQSTAPVRKRRILLVDDNEDAARMLAMYLSAQGHEVITEQTSQQAFERAQRETPEICILDIGLPEIDGNQLAGMLKGRKETAEALLIAVTGYGQEQDRQAAMAAGFDHYFVKPVDLGKLARLLEQ
ncbi:PAS domain-containing protein [Noviherbaspirillum sp. CPCC 100848]|uniref:histidine kinase n=1 Tax=Noviherbaspirillum album TaxID=3080276 RepID=A0ABU6JBB8_9BURK|nr:PAS domain-containing protein [Noviherbaspirillum sp. CPCC 100848]MEC4720840.1 PAS domain-containing protein [Noviherbaspirillum sp. CPCC 100848]